MPDVMRKPQRKSILSHLISTLLGVGAGLSRFLPSLFRSCVLLKISRTEMVRVLGREHALSDVFVSFLLERNARIQSDLVDQLFNSSEKRLARVLLLLAHFGKEGQPETVIPKLSQQTLAEIGTTRSRVSFFMNRFRELGFVKYNGEIQIHSSLLNVILHD
jgi:CRP/FNR family transcriptional regulator, cyclic AMP receptor protein